MRVPARVALPLILLTTIFLSCAPAGGSTRPRTDLSVITREQLDGHAFQTAREAVETLRRSWLADRGQDGIRSATEIVVYLDNSRLGGPESLSSILINNVESIRYIDGIQAFARWGNGHDRGVILVTTLSRPARTSPASEPWSSTGRGVTVKKDAGTRR